MDTIISREIVIALANVKNTDVVVIGSSAKVHRCALVLTSSSVLVMDVLVMWFLCPVFSRPHRGAAGGDGPERRQGPGLSAAGGGELSWVTHS